MKLQHGLLALLLGASMSYPLTPLARNPDAAKVLMPSEAGFAALRERYPALEGAYLATAGARGSLQYAAYRQADQNQLERMAQALLAEAMTTRGSTWVEDLERERLFTTLGSERVIVYQHRVDDIEVEGSMVVVRLRTDGGGEITNSLLAVALPTGPLMTPRAALQRAIGATSPIESMSGEAFPEKRYVHSQDGMARLAYSATTLDAEGQRWLLDVDAEQGRVLRRISSTADLDNAPDDIYWTLPSWIWLGTDNAGNPAECIASPNGPTTTPYYPPGFELPGLVAQVNLAGPAARFRNPVLGLTSIQWWGQSDQALQSAWPNWTWADLASNIPQQEGFANCPDGNYPPPQGFSGPVPYDAAELHQHHYLQVAMQDIDARFGWHGLNNQYNPLVLVHNVDPKLSCTTQNPAKTPTHFGLIACGVDIYAVFAGLPQRVPPVEVFAHEFGHTIINDLGFTATQDFDQKVVIEALADMFAVAAKSARGGDPWLVGDRPSMMERFKEWYCEAAGGGPYCDLPARLAVRDLANPKTMNPIDPGADFYAGDNWMKGHSITGEWNYHGSSQVVSGMLRRVAVGADAGARDGKPELGTYPAFAGIGLQETLDIFWESLSNLPVLNNSALPLDDYATEFRTAAVRLCGEWSEADLVAKKTAWIANMSSFDVDLTKAGYIEPPWDAQDVVPLVEFSFEGEMSQAYEFQVATDMDFTSIVHEDTVTTDAAGVGRFTLKLAPEQAHWWRVRLADAPMLASKWVNQDEACWRPAAPLRTGAPVQVTNPAPAGATAATGDEVEPWNVEFSWTGNPRFDGYEFWVDDEEPEGGKYSQVWAHKLFEGKDVPVDTENPGSADEPNFAVPPIPLPKSRHLCWKIIPFVRDDQGKRVDGDALEQCFRTSEPQTLITHPGPPAADGTLSHAPAQPLAIDYDPADGAESHEFSLRLLDLAGNDAPPAEGQWAYEDNITTDAANRVTEMPDPPDWTTRTRLRMLPVQLDASPYVNYALNRVRLTIKSRSPEISSKANGGTYPPRWESAEPAIRDFHPSEPANYTALHPYVTAPPAMGTCSSSDSPELSIAWDHGKDATPEAVEKYHIKLYPEHCGNGQPSGCHLLGDPLSPDFVHTLALDKSVKHNGKASQRVEFSRAELFPSEASETNLVTGFLAHLYGVSGPVPGPAGLNITGRMIVDLPVLPATLRAGIEFHDGGIEHPEWTEFRFWPETNVNAEHPYTIQNQFAPPKHEIRLRAYRGAGCLEQNFITEAPDRLELDLDQTGLSDNPNPVVSVRATMTWDSMLGPVLTSDCTSAHGINRQSKPEPVNGLTAREAGGQLGASWDVSADANPETLEYVIGLAAQGNDSANMLVNHPATVMLTSAELQSIEDQIGLHSLAVLDPSDIGKNVILRVMVCRAGTDKCSDEVTAMYTIGSAGMEGPLPTSPLDLALHFEENGGLPIEGGDPIFQTGWITASWNPPAGATAPSYYLVTFSSTGNVPGVLPTWLNALNIAGLNYPADPLQYSAVIRALPEGLVFTNTNWASFVWLLAETHQSGPPAPGTWVTARVWACAGTPPLPPLRAHDWIVGASTETCGVPAEVSAQYP